MNHKILRTIIGLLITLPLDLIAAIFIIPTIPAGALLGYVMGERGYLDEAKQMIFFTTKQLISKVWRGQC